MVGVFVGETAVVVVVTAAAAVASVYNVAATAAAASADPRLPDFFLDRCLPFIMGVSADCAKLSIVRKGCSSN